MNPRPAGSTPCLRLRTWSAARAWPAARAIAMAMSFAGCDGASGSASPMNAPSAMGAPHAYLPAQPAVLTATVDGDTARFHVADGERTVRFLFVNTEETHGSRATPFGVESAARVGDVLRRARSIALVFRPSAMHAGGVETDAYGRALGLVYVDGRLLQSWIVGEGLSPYYTSYGCATSDVHTALLDAEADARQRMVGIWQPGHPVDYRVQIERWVRSDPCRPTI